VPQKRKEKAKTSAHVSTSDDNDPQSSVSSSLQTQGSQPIESISNEDNTQASSIAAQLSVIQRAHADVQQEWQGRSEQVLVRVDIIRHIMIELEQAPREAGAWAAANGVLSTYFRTMARGVADATVIRRVAK
jgi:hypothetical protein